MTQLEQQKSLVDIEDSDPRGKLELAAARAEVSVSSLLQRAFTRSKLSQKDLADVLGVSAGRISQILSSSGNLRITTVARFLRALGYRLELSAIPKEPGVPPLMRRKRDQGQSTGVHAFGARENEQSPYTRVLITTGEHIHSPTSGNFDYLGLVGSGQSPNPVTNFTIHQTPRSQQWSIADSTGMPA